MDLSAIYNVLEGNDKGPEYTCHVCSKKFHTNPGRLPLQTSLGWECCSEECLKLANKEQAQDRDGWSWEMSGRRDDY